METANPDSLQAINSHCDNCGVRKRPGRLSLSYMLHRLREDLLGAERGLLLTVVHLFTRPQKVVSGFIQGDELRYYSPIKYFVVMLALSLIMPNDSVLDDFIVGVITSIGVVDKESTRNFVMDWNAVVYLPMLIMLALSTRAFFRDKAYNFAENLVVAAYGWSQMVLIGALVFSIGKLLSWLHLKNIVFAFLMLLPVVYWFWYCHGVFLQRTVAGWLRAFVTLPFAVVCYLFFYIFLFAIIKTIKQF